MQTYTYQSKEVQVTVTINKAKDDYVYRYQPVLANISETTELLLEKIREELIQRVSIGVPDREALEEALEERFKEEGKRLIAKYFPDLKEQEQQYLLSYLIRKSLGLGILEILFDDPHIEEVVVNSAKEPVWVYHKGYGWLKTTIVLGDEELIKNYAIRIGRHVGRQISILEPMLDAHLLTGDRANATLYPISQFGNTLTFRKFSRNPLTITHFLEYGTLTYDAAALLWQAIHYELSMLIVGGTASGKTSTLNVLATFFPPNQRIVSIEDTREIQLPKFLQWVPLMTRLPNQEGKGAVSMEDLLVNSLRMRPDRILVGEVRRREEIETLFEAIHTGHSCYATLHANDVYETVKRLLNPPFNVPLTMLPGISLIVAQFRNRRTGKRRTFQIAEITPEGKVSLLHQYDALKDTLKPMNEPKYLMKIFKTYTGMTMQQIKKELQEKKTVLQYLVKRKIYDVDAVGKVIAEYYTDKKHLLSYVKKNKPLP